MSTRAHIEVKDDYQTLYFYRHSDGYPSGALPTLMKFLNHVGVNIRDNPDQAAGWLILIGAEEYDESRQQRFDAAENDFVRIEPRVPVTQPLPGDINMTGWKCGAYEPTSGRHGDERYVYVIDLLKKEIRVYIPGYDDEKREPCPAKDRHIGTLKQGQQDWEGLDWVKR